MHTLHQSGAAIDLPTLLILLGNLLWTATYVVTVWRGFRDRSFGVPWPAICLNITWELLFCLNCPVVPPSVALCASARATPACPSPIVTLCPPPGTLVSCILWSWLALDAVILYQAVRFGGEGKGTQTVAKRVVTLAAGVAAAFGFHVAFIPFYADVGGTQDAWFINAVMSALFLALADERPDRRGLAWSAAWMKMLGSGLNVVGMLVGGLANFVPGHTSFTLLIFLFAAVFAMDCAYIFVTRPRR